MTLFELLRRFALFALMLALVGSCYLLSKQELVGPPMELPLTWIDRAIPLIVPSIWLYSSLTLLLFVVFVSLPDWLAARRAATAVALCVLVAVTCFVLWPTAYPRHLYPVPEDAQPISAAAMLDLREVDSPKNCLPSLHVALATVAGLCAFVELRRLRDRVAGGVWAAIVVASTLTTKQHFLVDVLAGCALGAVAVALVRRWMRTDTLSWIAARTQPCPLAPDEAGRLARLLQAVRDHQWRLEDFRLPEPARPLPPELQGFLSQVVVVEELAGLSFGFLAEASTGDQAELYRLFAAEERRHADAFRELLRRSGASIGAPGLGASIQLELFGSLDPRSDVDVLLVALAIPVFETFLDSGIIPFVQRLGQSSPGTPALDAVVERICCDERAHLAHNWTTARRMLSRSGSTVQLRACLNPHLLAGAVSIPLLAFEVFVHALRLGFDFSSLFASFSKVERMRSQHPEIGRSRLWWWFELFALVGRAAAAVVWLMQRHKIADGRWMVHLARILRWSASLLFGPPLFLARGIESTERSIPDSASRSLLRPSVRQGA